MFSSNNIIVPIHGLINCSKLRIVRNYESKNNAEISKKILIIQ